MTRLTFAAHEGPVCHSAQTRGFAIAFRDGLGDDVGARAIPRRQHCAFSRLHSFRHKLTPHVKRATPQRAMSTLGASSEPGLSTAQAVQLQNFDLEVRAAAQAHGVRTSARARDAIPLS
jgi:hypothetical protein